MKLPRPFRTLLLWAGLLAAPFSAHAVSTIYPVQAIGDLWLLPATEFRAKYPGIRPVAGLGLGDEGWYVRYQHDNLTLYFGPLKDELGARKAMWDMEAVRDAAIRNQPSLESSAVDYGRFTLSELAGEEEDGQGGDGEADMNGDGIPDGPEGAGGTGGQPGNASGSRAGGTGSGTQSTVPGRRGTQLGTRQGTGLGSRQGTRTQASRTTRGSNSNQTGRSGSGTGNEGSEQNQEVADMGLGLPGSRSGSSGGSPFPSLPGTNSGGGQSMPQGISIGNGQQSGGQGGQGGQSVAQGGQSGGGGGSSSSSSGGSGGSSGGMPMPPSGNSGGGSSGGGSSGGGSSVDPVGLVVGLLRAILGF